MSQAVDEFADTLNAEQYVDLQKLRSMARYGIPPSLRGEVWLYLLGVLSPDRTNEITSVRSKYASYTAMDKSPSHSNRIRLECMRYYNRRLLPQTRRRRQQLASAAASSAAAAAGGTVQPSVPNARDEEPMDIMAFTTSVENVLSAYLNRNAALEYHPGLVQLVAPFVWTLKTEAGMYFCFERWMSIYEDHCTSNPLSVRMSHFLALFRHFLPDLHAYFEEEAVDMRELAHAWLEGLFAKEMQIGMLMRVWDVYFAISDPLDFHPYVCLAILTTCKESLEELDQSEVRSMLLSLPTMDVDRLVVEASNLRLAYQHSKTRGERPNDD